MFAESDPPPLLNWFRRLFRVGFTGNLAWSSTMFSGMRTGRRFRIAATVDNERPRPSCMLGASSAYDWFVKKDNKNKNKNNNKHNKNKRRRRQRRMSKNNFFFLKKKTKQKNSCKQTIYLSQLIELILNRRRWNKR